MNKIVEIDYPFDMVTFDLRKLLARHARCLTQVEWAALEKAEQRIYTSGSGVYSYTDVNVREESELVAAMWDHAYSNAESAEENWDSWTGQARRAVVATRVARALALLVFHPDILLK